MKAKRLFLVFFLVLSLVISVIPTASLAVMDDDYEGNDSFKFKIDPPISTTVYFDEDGKETNDVTIYWIDFTVSDDGKYLSFDANNITVDLLSVKGGDNYRIYINEGSSGSGFRSPDNNGGQIPEISHYSFEITIDEPEEEPIFGEIDVTKTVIDHEDVVLEEDDHEFTFRLYKLEDGKWVEVSNKSPITIEGNGTATFENLPLGEYKVVEVNIPDGFTLDTDNELEFEIEEDGDEFKAEFTNKKAKDTPPPSDDTGKLTVHKRIQRINNPNQVDANLGDGEFTVRLSGPLPSDSDDYEVRDLVINQKDVTGDHVTFEDLPFGNYILEEVAIDDEEVTYDGYYIALPGNHGEEVDEKIEIESNGTMNLWLINKEETPPPSWDGTIRIQKSIRGEENASLQGFEFELWRNGEKIRGPEETDAFGELEFNELPAGIYEIKEVNSEYIAEYLDDNPVTIGPDQDMENDDVWVVRVNNYMIEKDDIVVQKQVSNDSDLSGFIFRLYRVVEGEEEFVDEKTTGVTGRIVFEEQPDGEYVLYEVSRTGYIMGIGAPGSENGEEFTHSDNMEYPINVTNRKLPPPPPPTLGRITVEKIVQTRFGNLLPNNNTRFYFVLELRGEGNTWMTVDNGSILGNGTLLFDDLEDGEYRVREVNIDDDFDLFSENNIIVEVEDASSEEVEFINRREPAPPPDDDDDDDDDDEPEDEPEEEEEEEDDEEVLDEVVVIEEPTPEAQPVPVIDEVVVEEEVVEVVEETPQAAPVATLPKTGTASPFAFSGLGGILLGLGLFLKKKE